MSKPYLLLDAGGTFVFIDQDYMAAIAAERGYPIRPGQVHDEHFRQIHRLDAYVAEHQAWPPRLNKPYYQVLFEAVGLPEDLAGEAAQVVQSRHEQRNVWTFTFPWVRHTLAELRDAGYRMSVISNADGRVQQQLEELDLAGYFETVYDSQIVGSQKPDPRIFEIAMKDLRLRPEEALYVGDIFHVDVLGANRAGIDALHLDPLGLYGGWPGEHVRDLSQLPGWLRDCRQMATRADLHPLAGFVLAEEGGLS